MQAGLRQTLSVGSEDFEFELCRKVSKENKSWGAVDVDQWWMDVTPLYAQRQNRKLQSRNHRQVIEYYWARCRQESATRERDAQERFLLASLLPLVRSQGSRRVFDDAFLRMKGKADQNQEVRVLEGLLHHSREQSLSEVDFYEKALTLLRSSALTSELEPKYQSLSGILLDEACQHLGRHADAGEAVAIASDRWLALMKQFGRRSRCDEEKLILDAISYEARAAFHHCYSVVWCGLLPKLVKDCGLNEQSLMFMSFWQTSRVSRSRSTPEHSWSLFHGHVFGLHPGTARFLLTATGRELMGHWLQNVEDPDAYGRLLHGLFLSLYDYAERRSQSAADRGQQARSNSPYEDKLDRDASSEFHRKKRDSKSDS